MKKIFSIVTLSLVAFSAQAHEILNHVAIVSADKVVSAQVDKIVDSSTRKNHYLFKGVTMSDMQTGCSGDRVYFDLQFLRLREVADGLVREKCKTTVTFGECGQSSGKVSEVGNTLSCVPEKTAE